MSWTDARIAELERLWGEGKSASEIAGLMGLTRNAIIGKAHRLGLDSRRDGMARPWSPARLDHLASLAEAGWSSRQIAREMGVNSSTVCNQIRLIGARLVRSKPKDGVTVAAPPEPPIREARAVPTVSDDAFRAAWSSDLPATMIAARLGLKESTARKMAERLGLPPKPPRADRAPQIIARVARAHVRPANLVGKREGRKHDPGIAKTPPEPPKPPDCAPVSLMAAGFGQCRFPVAVWSGPHAPFYCGAPTKDDCGPYCGWHARIAHGGGTPAEKRAHQVEGRVTA